ncbi:28S ribosomal protein S7, mitochondrial [Hyalella azteca]|uniref:28S ribosomal protein S7, mitochondrial n=1 Tax=Hyalella azteca TaxID=294128 RepID=A0A8B7NND4_HYAAZ|nr:28S ribosomal protein S7, mitochondrial [Hyalella azteca]
MLKNFLLSQQISSIGSRFPAAPAQFAVRSYAIYSPDKYLEPIYEKEQLEEIFQNKEIKERLQFSQIKPAEQSRSWSFFDHPRVNRLCNYVMKEGNKVLARNLVEETFTRIKRKQLRAYHTAETDEERRNIVCDPLTIYLGAVENCRPFLDLLPIKRGGITYQVPVPMSEKHSYFIATRWLVHAGRDRPTRRVHFPENLANELIDAFYGRGRVVQQKNDLHKQCEANRAYAHYR